MQAWGNKRANDYFEARVPRDCRRPNDHSSLREREVWIRDKYERKRFVAPEVPKSNKDSSDEDEEEEVKEPPRRAARDRRREQGNAPKQRARPPKQQNESVDILSFDDPVPAQTVAANQPLVAASGQAPVDDMWANFQGSSQVQTNTAAPQQQQQAVTPAGTVARFSPFLLN